MSGDGHLQVLVLVEVIRRSVSLPVEEARVERSTSAWSREEEMRRGGGYEENKGRKKKGGGGGGGVEERRKKCGRRRRRRSGHLGHYPLLQAPPELPRIPHRQGGFHGASALPKAGKVRLPRSLHRLLPRKQPIRLVREGGEEVSR